MIKVSLILGMKYHNHPHGFPSWLIILLKLGKLCFYNVSLKFSVVFIHLLVKWKPDKAFLKKSFVKHITDISTY